MVYIPKWKIFIILGICVLGIIFALPNALNTKKYSDWPEWLQSVPLGLDLRGGSQLLLDVDLNAGIKDQLSGMVDLTRGLLRNNKIRYQNLDLKGGAISFKLMDAENWDKISSKLQSEFPQMEIAYSSVDNSVAITPSEKRQKEIKDGMMQASIEMVRRRVDEFGTSEPNIQQQGDDRILVQLPGVSDPTRMRKLLGKTAKLTLRLVHPQSAQLIASGRVPPGTLLLKDNEEAQYIIERPILLGGENLEDARPGNDEYNRPAVDFRLDTFGGKRFGEITGKYKGRQLAIILDNTVISAPMMSVHIQGGRGQITGNFTVKQTNDLAILMRAGALPAPMTVIEERTVGPDLGADSIIAGEHATIIAIILVSIFMLIAYSFFGLVADIALVFNLILILAAMSVLQATLTLPGIAGIALTLGMAVDANVLIFERIKEELRNGLKPIAAIDAGYKRAMSTIIDSNLTTLIGSVLMYMFGSGPIRGFGVTLTLGILISMFTAISFTRVLVVTWLRWRKPTQLSI
jgi:preprotein translocase subunit SecD